MRLALLVLVAAAALSTPSAARLQPEIICLDPDMEFPVACDDDE
ncbi:MAG TPA: hypothetical protein VNR51_07235 [Hyphomicrobium sp.]|nr:hypothetical protein [Hyphomicrobium sp.]